MKELANLLSLFECIQKVQPYLFVIFYPVIKTIYNVPLT